MKYFNKDLYDLWVSGQSFEPPRIHRTWHLDDRWLILLIKEAYRQIGRLDMLTEQVPDIDLFIPLHITQEANQSSIIEGSLIGFEEVLMGKEHLPYRKRAAADEVQNLAAAMMQLFGKWDEQTEPDQDQNQDQDPEQGTEWVEHTKQNPEHGQKQPPISVQTIRNAQKVLVQNKPKKRGKPGEYRSLHKWFDRTLVRRVFFVPPAPFLIPKLLNDLDAFLADKENGLPDLVKLALLHYQFETIQPFAEGNGEVNRFFVTFYPLRYGLLKKPVLTLSEFLNRNRSEYHQCLAQVREKGDIEHWVQFFLTGLIESAENTIERFRRILQFQKQVETTLRTLGTRAENAQSVIRCLYRHPFVTAQGAAEVADVSLPTAYKLIRCLEDRDMLHEITGGARNRVYMFRDYVRLFTS